MPIRVESPVNGLFALAFGSGIALAGASCSSNGTTTTENGGSPSPGSLVSTCDTICNNLSPCASGSLNSQCLSVCSNLNLVPATCLNPFASYLACLAGAKSVSCEAGGQYVLVTPPECETDRQAFATCNAGPSVVAACLALSASTACTSLAPADRAEFCVGAPSGCLAPSPNPLGIGTYCCP